MKRLILSFISIGFGFLMVVVSAIATGQERIEGEVSAETAVDTQSDLIEASESASVQDDLAETSSDYYLPYPGILPDHMLYPLKMIRDKMRLLLANNLSTKTSLQLLYANKRIGAAEVLVNGGKANLGVDTAVKAEGYLSQAIASADEVNQPSFWDELHQAALKHYLVLDQMKDQVDANNLSRVEDALKLNKQLREVTQSKVQSRSQPVVETVDTEPEIDQITPAEFGR